MALYDNKYWLLSHITNSFISTDDTGMCEMVMLRERKDFKNHILNQEPYPELEEYDEDDDSDQNGSYESEMDMQFVHRERSNTAARLEKLDFAMKKAAKIKHVRWERNVEDDEDRNSYLFEQAPVVQPEPVEKSALSALLEEYIDVPLNPYLGYAKFDGTGYVTICTKKYKIYLTMLPEDQKTYPIHVCCIATARIHELIGLILLKLSTQFPDCPVKSPEHYGVYITEEDGEVDRDFPCLNPREYISKFGFTCLGLVEHKDKVVNFQNSASSVFDIKEEPITSSSGKRRTTSASKAEESKQFKNNMQAMNVHNRAMVAPNYESYRVFLVNKVRQRVEINLGISLEKFEIDPVQQTNSKFSFTMKVKPVSHQIEAIVNCEIAEIKSNKTTLRVLYNPLPGNNYGSPVDEPNTSNAFSFSPNSFRQSIHFKNYEFETDYNTADEIVHKVNHILEMRPSKIRKEYLLGW